MKLLNYNELKTLLLEERDKIPLTVPGARGEINIPQPNKHGESMRGGIRIALRCMERCQPVLLGEVRPHGRWLHRDNGIAYCSECDTDAVEDGTNFCPECGADMLVYMRMANIDAIVAEVMREWVATLLRPPGEEGDSNASDK